MSHVCVDAICVPSGSCILRGLVAVCRFVTGAVVTRKWLVAPESRIAQFLRSSMLIDVVCSSDFAAYWYLCCMGGIVGSVVGVGVGDVM